MAATKTTQSKKSTTSTAGKFPSFPTFPSIDFSKLQVPKFDTPKFDLPKFEMPKFEMPTVDLPKFEVPAVDAEAITNAAKDVAYIGIGVALLAAQKAQELGRDVTKTLNEQYSNNKSQIDEFVGTIDSRLVDIEGTWNSAVEEFGKRLPEPASTLLEQAHDAAKSARQQLRAKVVPAAA